MTSPDRTKAKGEAALPAAIMLEASDGYKIAGFVWHKNGFGEARRPVVIINPATSVRCRYYFRFAAFLFENGFDVIAYDYRGIGESRPADLRRFEASWIDWGRLDFEAVLRYAERCLYESIHVVAHSVGGFVLGFAESSNRISRIFTMGAQYAYRKDYAEKGRLKMLAKWHVAMPVLTSVYGYFPGKRLGWLEDTPRGVVRDWTNSRQHFEDTWRGRHAARHPSMAMLVERFASVTAPTLAVSVTDDEFGTVPAIERLLAYYKRSLRLHLRISPDSIDEPAIGHFGFFNSKFQQKLWGLPVNWLKTGQLPDPYPGTVVGEHAAPSPAPRVKEPL